MLSDPQTITVNAVAKVLPRIKQEGQSSLYMIADQTFSLEVSHQPSKKAGKNRIRTMVRFTQRKVVPDPLTAVNDFEDCPIQLVIDRPQSGFSATEIDQLWAGFKTWLDTAQMTKLVEQQS
jgi:hypothetical protein